MDRTKLRPSVHFFAVGMAAVVLVFVFTAAAQNPSPVPATPPSTASQTPAQKRQAAAQARQAAAAQARQNAAQARQTAVQNKAAARAARTQQKPQAASKPANPPASPAAAAPPATSGKSVLPSASTAQPGGTQTGGGGAVGNGTLAWATRVYSSTGCVHNGNSAMCTFTFVNQGNEANLTAGGAGELSGIQLVDDAHVPHRWSSAYFMDKYGAQQRRLIVQPGDTGTYVVVFPNVDSRVASAEFHLRTQIIGGISFGEAGSNAAASSPASSTPVEPAATGTNGAVAKAGPTVKNGNNTKK